MRALTITVLAALTVVVGCQWLGPALHPERVPAGLPTFYRFHLEGWDWNRVDRIMVLPVLNESPYTRAGREVEAALTSNLQQLGRFEIVAGPPDDQALLARIVHRGGRFDESVMLDIGQTTRADVILHATVTHYSPYPRPRLGLIVLAIAPREAKVVAQVDGVWDTTNLAIAERLRAYYRQHTRPRPPWIKNHRIVDDDSFAGELALDSPALFQQFVCQEAVLSLLGLPVPGLVVEFGRVSGGGMHSGVGGAACPR